VGVGLRESDDGAVVTTDEDGVRRVQGSVLRGVADELILAAAPGRTVLDVPVSDAEAADAGLVCGGRARLLLSPVDQLPTEAVTWLGDAQPVVIAATADGRGGDFVVSPHGTAGELASAVLTKEAFTIARTIIRGGASVAEIHDIDGTTVLFSAAIPTTRALIVGGGPMAEAFRAQGELMGWQVQLTDQADPAVTFCTTATAADAVLVLSHDPAVDTPALAAALTSSVGYIGAMGSRHTQAARAERLVALGHTEHSRIHGPVGLDLGSRTPPETAVAMAAEFLAVRRGRPPTSLSAHEGPIHS